MRRGEFQFGFLWMLLLGLIVMLASLLFPLFVWLRHRRNANFAKLANAAKGNGGLQKLSRFPRFSRHPRFKDTAVDEVKKDCEGR